MALVNHLTIKNLYISFVLNINNLHKDIGFCICFGIMFIEMLKNRNYGIDLLRLFAMIGIVVLHTLRRSQLITSAISSQYTVVWIIEIIFYSSVNCFGIITGFVSYDEKNEHLKISNYLMHWLQVVFYGIAICLITDFATNRTVTSKNYYTSLFPLLFYEYWYFSAYTGVFLVSSFVNKGIRNLNDKQIKQLFFIIILVFSFLETITYRVTTNNTLSQLNSGYGFAWLLILYILGAIIKRQYLASNTDNTLFKSKVSLAAIVVLLLGFTMFWMFILGPSLTFITIGKGWDKLFVRYTSPTILLSAFFLVILFSRIHLPKPLQSFLQITAPSVFSVYILNSHPLITKYFYNKKYLLFLQNYNGLKLIASVLLCSISFTIVALLIDQVRILLFKVLRIKQLTKAIDKLIHLDS